MLTIRRILFPTDLSVGARQAFPQAAYLADQHDAELHILTVANDRTEGEGDIPIPTDTLAEWIGTPPDADSPRGTVEALSITQKRIEAAAAAEGILAYTEDEDIDLVVMGTHGRRGVTRLLFGSVTEEVVRNAPCPVLTVRTGAADSPERAVQRLLVPIDFSEASEVALRHAMEIARTYDAELDLLHVVEEVVYPSTYGVEPAHFPTQEIRLRVERQLGNLVRENMDDEHVTNSVLVGYAPTSILDHVEENDIDLVVIATHGRTGLDRLLLGSVAERVIRRCPAPVFVVKPDRKSLLPMEGSSQTASAD